MYHQTLGMQGAAQGYILKFDGSSEDGTAAMKDAFLSAHLAFSSRTYTEAEARAGEGVFAITSPGPNKDPKVTLNGK